PNIYQKIQTLALKAHQAIGCRGVSRSDFRYDDRHSENGEIVWLEVNTQPGMTPTSLVPEIAAQAGHSFGDLLSWMVEDASCLR
ncbi:D-alanine--D-alanine ligase, partial [Mesorhizobium sp. M7A.F.Ca.CA.004.04.2.1]